MNILEIYLTDLAHLMAFVTVIFMGWLVYDWRRLDNENEELKHGKELAEISAAIHERLANRSLDQLVADANKDPVDPGRSTPQS